jgi:D-psicose/D-tagatose/L-ribulose 3-epimerase
VSAAPVGATGSARGCRLSVCSGPLTAIPLRELFGVLGDAGIDGVELLGEPSRYEGMPVARMLADHGLAVTALTASARLPTERDLSGSDRTARENAVSHLLRCVDFGHEVGAPVLSVAPSAVGRYWLTAPAEQEREWAIAGLRRVAGAAAGAGMRVAVETLNRYATPSIRTVRAALRLLADAEVDGGVVLDVFHAALEERSLADAVRAAGGRLLNVQVADNTRQGPGQGHIDFTGLARALSDIGYSGSLALEAYPEGSAAFPTVDAAGLPEVLGYIMPYRDFMTALPIRIAPCSRRAPDLPEPQQAARLLG